MTERSSYHKVQRVHILHVQIESRCAGGEIAIELFTVPLDAVSYER